MYTFNKVNNHTGLKILVETSYSLLDDKILNSGGLKAKKILYKEVLNEYCYKKINFGYAKLRKCSEGMIANVELDFLKEGDSIIALSDCQRKAVYLINFSDKSLLDLTEHCFYSRKRSDGTDKYFCKFCFILTPDGILQYRNITGTKMHDFTKYIEKVILY